MVKKQNIEAEELFVKPNLIKAVEKYKALAVSVSEVTKISGKGRSTIYRILKKEFNFVSDRFIKVPKEKEYEVE